jgi:hypothetical protein
LTKRRWREDEIYFALGRDADDNGDFLMKPMALDLCSGKGGWTHGLLASGWGVIGVDIEAWEGYPRETHRIITDVRTLDINKPSFLALSRGRKISLVCASPPCQEFSYRSFPFKRCRELAATVPPDESIWRACERIARECNAPLILENVRGAQKYMGKSVTHYGSFYLWGDVPAMLPIGRPVKGFTRSKSRMVFNYNRTKGIFPGECERVNPVTFKKMVGSEKYKNRFEDHPSAQMSSKSMSRKEWSARAAMIPLELSYWIGQCFKM